MDPVLRRLLPALLALLALPLMVTGLAFVGLAGAPPGGQAIIPEAHRRPGALSGDRRSPAAVQAAARAPDPEALAVAGARALEAGELLLAEWRFRRAVTLAPATAHYHNALAVVLSRRGEDADALRHLERAIALEPGLAVAHYNRGRLFFRLGRRLTAASAFRAAVAADPGLVAAHQGLGDLHLAAERWPAALVAYRRALRLNGRSALTWRRLATVYSGLGKWERARAALEKSAVLAPVEAPVHYELGLLYARAGELDRARRALWRAWALADPAGPWAIRARARLAALDRFETCGSCREELP